MCILEAQQTCWMHFVLNKTSAELIFWIFSNLHASAWGSLRTSDNTESFRAVCHAWKNAFSILQLPQYWHKKYFPIHNHWKSSSYKTVIKCVSLHPGRNFHSLNAVSSSRWYLRCLNSPNFSSYSLFLSSLLLAHCCLSLCITTTICQAVAYHETMTASRHMLVLVDVRPRCLCVGYKQNRDRLIRTFQHSAAVGQKLHWVAFKCSLNFDHHRAKTRAFSFYSCCV